jgi:hypothetical protein
MGSPSVSLSYSARREVLAQIAPRYQEATGAHKMLLLDRVVEVTGYARKYAITSSTMFPKAPLRSCVHVCPSMVRRFKRRSSWLGEPSSIRVRSAWFPVCPV